MRLPEKFEDRMKKMLGDEYDDFIKSMDETPIFTGIRINTSKVGAKDAVIKEFGELQNVPWCSDGFYADKSKISGNHPYHFAGLFYFQEPSAMSTVSALNIESDDYVLDLCAAPGGKATQAGAFIGKNGLLVANEIVKNRANILSDNIDRFGLTNAVVTNETPQRLAEKYVHFFDKIIVDTPCSGEGMFRKEPQALEHWSREHVEACAVRQLNILESAKLALKPGGVIVYSTCTFSPEENEGVIEKFLDNNPDFEIVDENESFGMKTMGGAVRIFPFHGGEGHFAVKLKHKGMSIGSDSYFYDSFGDSSERKGSKKQCKNQRGKVQSNEITREEILDFYDSLFVNRPFGENISQINGKIILLPEALKKFLSTEKCGVLRAGVLLGEGKKGRIEPAHSAFMAAEKDECVNTVDLSLGDERIIKYLKGEEIEIPSDIKGYTAVCCEGMTTGFGKAVDGTLKNKYPKGLRLL